MPGLIKAGLLPDDLASAPRLLRDQALTAAHPAPGEECATAVLCPGKREVQAGGLADQDIHAGARHTELLAEPDTGDRLGVGKHVQQGAGLLGGQPGQPTGVAGQQGFGLRAQAPPLLRAFAEIAHGFLGERHELPPGREADLAGDDQPRVAKLGGGGVGGGGVPGT